jgi:lipopolysaccharide transport system permease protein
MKRILSYIGRVWRIRHGNRTWALLSQLTWRNFAVQHRGSYLGLAWSVISPLMIFGVYAFVFIAIFHGRYGVVPSEKDSDYAIGLLLSLTLLQLIQEVLAVSPFAVLQNANYVKRVVFPVAILPAAAFGGALLRFLVSIAIVVAATLLFGPGLTRAAWWFPVISLMLCLLGLGLSWFLAAVGVFLRDLGPFTQSFSILLMFMSGVFYSLKQIPAHFRFLRFNPILIALECSRGALLWKIVPSAGEMIYLGAVSALVCIGGYALFRYLRPAFADVI